MPKPGQKSITIPDETDQLLRETFARHEAELKREGVRSVPQLIHYAISRYAEELEEKLGRKAFESFMYFFNRRPDLLKKMGFQSSGQFLEELIKEYAKAEKPVRSE